MFKFTVRVTEQDYLDFNDFVLLKTPYGKKQTSSLRFLIVAIFCLFAIINLFYNGFSTVSITTAVFTCLIGVAFSFLYIPLVKRINKITVRNLNKKGKPCYSENSTISFDEHGFTETTADGSTSLNYSALECVSVVNGNTVYLHQNKMLAYIIPPSSFSSDEELDEFLKFLSTKINNMNLY